MYIDQIKIQNFRTFSRMASPIQFLRPDLNYRNLEMPRPRLRNVNLLLGDNGSGKTSMLKTIALAALGPAVGKSGIFPYRLVRIPSGKQKESIDAALIEAEFIAHGQDDSPFSVMESRVEVVREGDLESLEWTHEQAKEWHPVFQDRSDAMFVVGYGSNRRIEKPEHVRRRGRVSERASRVMSLFEEDYALRPLNTWLPELRHENKKHHDEVVKLIDKLLGKGSFEFTGEQGEDDEYVFDRNGVKVPLPALSDGYRAYLGWIGDLLYHVSVTCPPGKPMVTNRGIVMVDEIDLHLHPKWQMKVLPDLARALPNIQFIATSHSPLVVGSLEWMNIIVMKAGASNVSKPQRIEHGIYGLDADQVLLTELFGLDTTRSPSQTREMDKLSQAAAKGDEESAKLLLERMTRGREGSGK